MWDKTITIYNKHEDKQTGLIKWYRHVLTDCFFKTTNNEINIGSVLVNSDDSIIRIPTQNNYLSPFDWEKLPNEKKSQYLTINKGDLIFLGEVNDEIDEYLKDKRSSDIIEKYKLLGSVVVKSINVNDFGPLSHYFVRGK